MPLFKGVSSKATPKTAIDYITDDEKAQYVTSLNMIDSEDYSTQFADTASLFGKGKKYDERKYYHFKLSCDPEDHVAPDEHHIFAEELAAELFPNHEIVLATHTDTDVVHTHIIVNAVNFETGRKLDIRRGEYAYMKDRANELGERYGFTPLDFRSPSEQRTTSEERHIFLRGGISWKDELREVIELAKMESLTMEDFAACLESYGVKIVRNTRRTISFQHPMKERPIRGKRLGLDFTKEAIENELTNNRWKNSERTVGEQTELENNWKTNSPTDTRNLDAYIEAIADRAPSGLGKDGKLDQHPKIRKPREYQSTR